MAIAAPEAPPMPVADACDVGVVPGDPVEPLSSLREQPARKSPASSTDDAKRTADLMTTPHRWAIAEQMLPYLLSVLWTGGGVKEHRRLFGRRLPPRESADAFFS